MVRARQGKPSRVRWTAAVGLDEELDWQATTVALWWSTKPTGFFGSLDVLVKGFTIEQSGVKKS